MKTINLELHRTKGAKVFTGRDRGIQVRKDTKIDDLEKTEGKIIIEIPKDIMSVNPSFLEEFLYNVVTKLKKNKFYEKFEFGSKSERYDIAVDLEEAVDRILRKENALTKE
jgi:hypothetical protein